MLASIAMQPGGGGAFAMVAINLARDWKSRRRAFRLHPWSTNFHYADVDGNTGWQVIGFAPVRKQGDGRFDWAGMRDFASLPNAYNPKKGWFASASQNNLPTEWPQGSISAFSFRAPYRYERITGVLVGQLRHSIADSVALQAAHRSPPRPSPCGIATS